MMLPFALERLVLKFKERQHNKRATENALWFDANDSYLHKGSLSLRIEKNSYHYFICKFTFTNPSEYYDDDDIFEARDKADESPRGVQAAVRNLNIKCRESLQLEQDLFLWVKSSTTINKTYRSDIINLE